LAVAETKQRGATKYVIAAVRATIVLIVVVAIVSTFVDTASRATINPFNFFGFFTMQSNVICAVVLAIAVLTTLRGRPQPAWLVLARACATTYIVVVGIFYNLLLAGLEGGVSLAWANFVLHSLFPIYAALDWIFFGDRTALSWKRLPFVLVYPVLWIIVVLIRGATDGWVPYPFLDPATGYGSVAVYSLVIFAATVVIGAIVFALSRVRIIRP
jgi:hypothetical protein